MQTLIRNQPEKLLPDIHFLRKELFVIFSPAHNSAGGGPDIRKSYMLSQKNVLFIYFID